MTIRNRMKQILPAIVWRVRRRLHPSAMTRVLRQLREKGVGLRDLDALEVFGGSGDFHTLDYASEVSTLEVWEIKPEYQSPLRRRLPAAEVKIVDSFKELKETTRKFSLIVVDNPMSTYGGHCEHFDLFPDLFRVSKDSAIVILNVIPEIDAAIRSQYPYLFNATQLVCRKSFYKTDHPDKVSLDEMTEVYKNLFRINGFDLEWCFYVKRTCVYYFVTRIKKSAA